MRIALTRLKTVELAPMPRPRVRRAAAVKPGRRARLRMASRASPRIQSRMVGAVFNRRATARLVPLDLKSLS